MLKSTCLDLYDLEKRKKAFPIHPKVHNTQVSIIYRHLRRREVQSHRVKSAKTQRTTVKRRKNENE